MTAEDRTEALELIATKLRCVRRWNIGPPVASQRSLYYAIIAALCAAARKLGGAA